LRWNRELEPFLLACLHNPWDKLPLYILCDFLEEKGVLPDLDRDRTLWNILPGAWPENADEIANANGTFGWFFGMLRVVMKARYDVAACKSREASREAPVAGAEDVPSAAPPAAPALPAARAAM
jgi:hypothetical protein